YSFPGNIRELSNLVERAVLFCTGTQLEPGHFPADLRSFGHEPLPVTTPEDSDPRTLHLPFRMGEDTLDGVERRLIADILARSGGNKTRAAQALGISRWALDRRLKGDQEGAESRGEEGV
ncbi:MAG: sigma-54-dependent Fis family transcriptional regulator, partial [Nitrospiraceae bacterium]|nr:sigma-54-dependent Fis family transcriptional regulator [Nitrospiraceae bacterium]